MAMPAAAAMAMPSAQNDRIAIVFAVFDIVMPHKIHRALWDHQTT